jgi:predicted dehydrogenase
MKPVRYGMIGGGQGSGIGGVHRTAAAIAGNWQLVAGALSSTSEKAKASGEELGLPADRNYGSWAEMLVHEAALPADLRIEAVSVVTPNHMHAAPAIAALEAGFDVIIDKPLADTLENARAIADAVARTGQRIAVTGCRAPPIWTITSRRRGASIRPNRAKPGPLAILAPMRPIWSNLSPANASPKSVAN